MAPRNAQGQRGKYLTLALSGTRNLVEDMCAIVNKFQSAKIGACGNALDQDLPSMRDTPTRRSLHQQTGSSPDGRRGPVTLGCHLIHQPLAFARQRIDDGLEDSFGWRYDLQRACHITERLQDKIERPLSTNGPLNGLSGHTRCSLLLMRLQSTSENDSQSCKNNGLFVS